MIVLDYSWARPSPQSMLDYGASGVMRYLGPGNGGRDITPGECETLHDAGLGVGLVWETTAARALEGYDAGAYDAGQADYWAAYCHAPDELPIYFAVDTDVNPNQTWGPVLDYFAGAMCSAHPTRAYGEADVIDMMAQAYGAPYGWQAAAPAWSDWRTSANTGMLQSAYYVLDDQCDHNDVLCPNDCVDWLWNGGSMGLSQNDLNQINQIVNDGINAALSRYYTGARALKTPDSDTQYELVVMGDGTLAKRAIPSLSQVEMLKWADHIAGPPDADPRTITDPAYLD